MTPLSPLKCKLTFIPNFLSQEEANKLFQHLTADYHIDQLLFDSPVYQIHKLSFMDASLKETEALPEAIWGKAEEWSTPMTQLKSKVEQLAGKEFRVCVAILYPDGNHGVGYHSDYPAFGDTSVIASLSIGAIRTFKLKDKETGQEHDFEVNNGTLIIMGENCQENYQHAVPIEPESKEPRINLTFRMYGF